jgi:hypothetical protein
LIKVDNVSWEQISIINLKLLCDIMLRVAFIIVMLSVVMLNVVMPSVIMFNVAVLNVVAPQFLLPFLNPK